MSKRDWRMDIQKDRWFEVWGDGLLITKARVERALNFGHYYVIKGSDFDFCLIVGFEQFSDDARIELSDSQMKWVRKNLLYH